MGSGQWLQFVSDGVRFLSGSPVSRSRLTLHVAVPDPHLTASCLLPLTAFPFPLTSSRLPLSDDVRKRLLHPAKVNGAGNEHKQRGR